jgi:hypothetical protein
MTPANPANPTEMTDAPHSLGLQPSELRSTAVMARPRRRVFPGHPEQVAHARRFVAQTLDGCPIVDEAVLCVSELASNALAHTASGRGGEFEVIVCRGEASALLAVYDDGSDTPPTARGLDATSENGRGLGVVALTASRWGHFGGRSGRVVWFEMFWDPPPFDDSDLRELIDRLEPEQADELREHALRLVRSVGGRFKVLRSFSGPRTDLTAQKPEVMRAAFGQGDAVTGTSRSPEVAWTDGPPAWPAAEPRITPPSAAVRMSQRRSSSLPTRLAMAGPPW